MAPPARLVFACCALFGSADAALQKPTLTLLNADARNYAPLIVKALYRDNVAGTSLSALAETEKPIDGDNWFWTDDNAKALEALTLPPVFPSFTTQVGQMVKFIIANSPPPFVFRRRAEDRTLLKSDNVEDFRLATGLMNFHGNLRQAEVRQGYRFHDFRNLDAVKFTGDYVRFAVKGKTYTSEVKQTAQAELRRTPTGIVLFHSTPLKDATGTVGTANYAYTIDRGRTYVTLEVTVAANPGNALDDVEVTTALDQLDSLSNVRFYKFFGFRGTEPPVSSDAKASKEPRTLVEGPVKWWALIQGGNLGDAHSASTLVNSPERLRSIVSLDEQNGAFRHIRARYGLGQVLPEHPVTVSEKKVLLAGGLYNNMGAYDGVFSHLNDFPGLDFSISYDIGAEINGVASAYLADKQRLDQTPGATPVAYVPETRAWFDAIAEAYMTNFLVKVGNDYPYIFSRGLSFVALALDTMYSATKDARYVAPMRKVADTLLTFQVKQGPLSYNFNCDHHIGCFLDCHAAAMVALARVALLTGDRRYAEAAQKGLGPIQIDDNGETGKDVFVKPRLNAGDVDGYYWIFKGGILLRSLESLSVLDERGLIHLSADEWRTIFELRRRTLAYLARTAHQRGNLTEIFTCHKAGETNSETQAWALLGMHRIEHERTEGR